MTQWFSACLSICLPFGCLSVYLSICLSFVFIFWFIHFIHFLVVPEVILQNISSTQPFEGETIALTCSVSGGWPRIGQIQWLRDGIPIDSTDPRVTIDSSPIYIDLNGLYSQTSNLTITESVRIGDSGVYTCKSYLNIPRVPMVSENISITVFGMF